MSFLTPCEACNRHLESTETNCPFCGAIVSAAMRARRPTLPSKRLGRAALMAFGATVAGTATGCGGSEDATDSSSGMTTQTTEPSASPNPSGTTTAPRPQNTGSGPTSPATIEPTMAVAAYGVPILPPQPFPTNDGNGGQGPEATGGSGGSEMNEPEPMVEPEPFAMAAYGVFPLEPIDPPIGGSGSGGAEAVGGSGAGGSEAQDAGAPDAGEPEPESAVEPEPVVEPEPMAVPAYGIFPLPTD